MVRGSSEAPDEPLRRIEEEEMPKLHQAVDVAGEAAGSRRKQPVLSRRWLRDAAAANRSAFELEMRRERRRLLDSRFDAFWKEISARQA